MFIYDITHYSWKLRRAKVLKKNYTYYIIFAHVRTIKPKEIEESFERFTNVEWHADNRNPVNKIEMWKTVQAAYSKINPGLFFNPNAGLSLFLGHIFSVWVVFVLPSLRVKCKNPMFG